jgi:hypothetical protein
VNDLPIKRTIFQYLIASGDMRFIDRTERAIVLIGDWGSDWVIRGEVPGCGDACHNNLAHILLEFLLSCEGCEAPSELRRALDAFTERVKNSIKNLLLDSGDSLGQTQAQLALEGLLRSMGANHRITDMSQGWTIVLETCPICQCAEETGIQRGLEAAHDLFMDVLHQTLRSFMPHAKVISRIPWHAPDHFQTLLVQTS